MVLKEKTIIDLANESLNPKINYQENPAKMEEAVYHQGKKTATCTEIAKYIGIPAIGSAIAGTVSGLFLGFTAGFGIALSAFAITEIAICRAYLMTTT